MENKMDYRKGLLFFCGIVVCGLSFVTTPDGLTLFHQFIGLFGIGPGIPVGEGAMIYPFMLIPVVLFIFCAKKVFYFWQGYGTRFNEFNLFFRFLPVIIVVVTWLAFSAVHPSIVDRAYFAVIARHSGLRAVTMCASNQYVAIHFDENNREYSYGIILNNHGSEVQEFNIKLAYFFEGASETFIRDGNGEIKTFMIPPHTRTTFRGEFTIYPTESMSTSGNIHSIVTAITLVNENEQHRLHPLIRPPIFARPVTHSTIETSAHTLLSEPIEAVPPVIEPIVEYEEIYIPEPKPPIMLEDITLENLLLITNQRRQVVHEPDMELISSWIEAREPITFDGARLFDSRRNSNLSATAAAYDIVVLFELLRHIYAGYHYFGGDEIFLPMRDKMLEEINQRERWADTQLFQLIQGHLGAVIVDYHFLVNAYSGSTFGKPHHSFVWSVPFDRSENGFRKRETGEYILYVDGHEKDEIFRLTMNEAGEFFYAPVVFRPASEGVNYSLRFIFENGEEETVNLTRTVHERTHARGARSSLRYENGVPIVSIRRMWDFLNPYANNHQYALRVLGYAEQLRDEPIIIVDIRSNEGGASAFSYAWLYGLLGEVVPSNFNWLGFFDSPIDVPQGVSRPERWYRGFSRRSGFDFEYPPELFGKYLHMNPIAENIDFTTENARDRVIYNEQLIIVLVDRFTLSSGEIFADQFTNVENTLVIGQNTFGMLLTSSGLPLYLPNSGMPVSMGRYKLVHPENTWQEGVGFSPDIWVLGDALTAAWAILDLS